MKRIRAVAFDLGNVLVDVRKEALAAALQMEHVRASEGFFRGDRHDLLTVGELSAADFLADGAAAVGAALALAEEGWSRMVCASEGAAALVEQVAVDVLAWSNTDPVHFAALRDALPPRLWERRALSFELGTKKPLAAFFTRALDAAALRPDEVFFLDDLPENVAAARAAGIDACCVRGVDAARRALEERGLLHRRAS